MALRSAAALLALLAPVLVGAPPPAVAAPSSVAVGAAAPASRPLQAYLLTATGIVPVDLRSRTAEAEIITPGRPSDLVISPSGTRGHVLVAGELLPVDLISRTVWPGAYIGTGANAVALTPDGRTAWVTDQDARDLTPVDTATGKAGRPISIGALAEIFPQDVVVTPDGRRAYVATDCWGRVVPVDLASRTVGQGPSLPAGSTYPCPKGLAVTPDGRTVYATDSYSGAGLSRIDVATGTVVGTVYLDDSGGSRIALTPDGRKAYVDTGDVAVVDLRRQVPGDRLSPDGTLREFAMHPSGRTLLVTHRAGGVVPIDTRTDEVGPAFLTSIPALDVVVAPDQAPVAGLRTQQGPGRTATFDASSSVGVTSPVARYAWRFGDGTRRTTTTPVVEHTYAGPGSYRVRLTVTDRNGTSTTPVWTGHMLLRNGSPRATTTRVVDVP